MPLQKAGRYTTNLTCLTSWLAADQSNDQLMKILEQLIIIGFDQLITILDQLLISLV